MASKTNLYVGTDRGLLLCRADSTGVWHPLRRVLDGRAVLRVAPGSGSSHRLAVLVRGDGIFHSTDGGQEWLLTLPAVIVCLLDDPLDGSRLYAGLAARAAQGGTSQLGEVMVSPDGGRVWMALAALPGVPPDVGVSALAVTEGSGDLPVVWAGLSAGGILATYDGGASWQWRRSGLDLGASVSHLVPQRTRHPGLYVASGGVYYLNLKHASDGALGATGVWRRCYPNATAGQAPGPAAPGHLLLVQPSGHTAPAVLATDGRGLLWRSSDQGEYWTLLNTGATGLPASAFVTTLAAHPSGPANLFLGTAAGEIYESADGGNSWTAFPFVAGGSVLTLALARG